MTMETSQTIAPTDKRNWIEIAESLGPDFANRAAKYDEEGRFVEENYADLRTEGFFWAGIPEEVGGNGASHREMSNVITELAKYCGSTALSFAMHTHPVLTNVFKHKSGDKKATGALEKIAEKKLVVAGTGANDWLGSSGSATEVEGGFLVNAEKRFVSGAPGAQLFVTSVRHESEKGAEVIHFAVPFNTGGVELVNNWDALGMRGTGSLDVIMKDVFVPEAAVVVRRPADVWHPMWNAILPIAMPLIASAYVGMAEEAARLATEAAEHVGAGLAGPVGEMLNSLTVAQMAREQMLENVEDLTFSPTLQLANDTLVRKTIVAEAVKSTVEMASEVIGGRGFSRRHPIERIVRDIRAIHFHPLPKKRQVEFSGRVGLGLDPVG